MDKLKKTYNLNKSEHVQELLDLIENGDLSDIEDIGCGSEDDDDLIDDAPFRERVRPGDNFVSRQDEERPEIGCDNVENDEEYIPPSGHDDDNNNATEDKNGNSHQINYDNIEGKRKVNWKSNAVDVPDWNFERSEIEYNEIGFPLEYFMRYLPLDIFAEMAKFTNIYALQTGKTFKNTSTEEIQVLIGLHIIIGCLNKFPRVRMYWERVLGINLFLDNMTRDRFFQLRMNLHVVNNLERPQDCKDKLYKVRPILNSIRKRLLELEPEEYLCVDEQMIPFTGKLSIKQYVKGKPIPWGIKVFVLCGKSGQAYDFIIYQGQSTEMDPNIQKKFGLASSVVLHLSRRIEKQGHKLYFDNYFSSYLLFEALKEQKIFAAGTVRINRFFKPPLISDSDIKKKKRGFSQELVSNEGIIITKWLDNKSVYLASNYVGRGALDKVTRWDKTESKYIEVDRPQVVKDYNFSMGGVDLLDQLISTYRIFIRSKKWTLRVVMHFIDFALTNAWLEYRRDAKNANIPKISDLLDFRMRVAEGLIRVNKPVKQSKRGLFSIYSGIHRFLTSSVTGRPSHDVSNATSSSKINRSRGEKRPLVEIQSDLLDHMPQFDENKEATRCKNPGCRQRSHVYCDKCSVHLCLVRNRNCFVSFHRRSN